MLGGEAIEHDNFSIVSDIGLLQPRYSPCRGVWRATAVDANLAAHHHEPIYHKNTRVTDAKALELVKQAAGLLQLDITAPSVDESEQYAVAGRALMSSAAISRLRSRWAFDDGVDTVAAAGKIAVEMKIRSNARWIRRDRSPMGPGSPRCK